MNKKDKKHISGIIKKLTSLRDQIEEVYGEIDELATELRDRYDDESRYYDDAQTDADSLDDIYSEDYDNVYDSIDNTIDCLSDLLDEEVVVEHVPLNEEKADEKYEVMLETVTEITLKQIEENKDSLDEMHYRLNVAKVKSSVALCKQSVREGKSIVESYIEYSEKMKTVYLEMGGDRDLWEKQVVSI